MDIQKRHTKSHTRQHYGPTMNSFMMLVVMACVSISETVLRLETENCVPEGETTRFNCTTDEDSFREVPITIKRKPNRTVFACQSYNTCVKNLPGYFYNKSLSTPNKIVMGITSFKMDDYSWTCQYEMEGGPKAQKNITVCDTGTPGGSSGSYYTDTGLPRARLLVGLFYYFALYTCQ